MGSRALIYIAVSAAVVLMVVAMGGAALYVRYSDVDRDNAESPVAQTVPPDGLSQTTRLLRSPRGGKKWRSYFPNVELITHHGKKVRFYDDLVKGKIVVINFMYTTCTGT